MDHNDISKAQARALTNQVRETSGKFGHGLEALCKCGRTKGQHSAARPFTIEEDLGDGLGGCQGFKAKR